MHDALGSPIHDLRPLFCHSFQRGAKLHKEVCPYSLHPSVELDSQAAENRRDVGEPLEPLILQPPNSLFVAKLQNQDRVVSTAQQITDHLRLHAGHVLHHSLQCGHHSSVWVRPHRSSQGAFGDADIRTWCWPTDDLLKKLGSVRSVWRLGCHC